MTNAATSEPSKPDAPQAAFGLAPCSALWAVSVVLTLHKPDGKLNVLNHLQRVRAANKDEAVGTAIRVSMEQCPEHQLHCYTALQFADEPNGGDELRPQRK